MFLKLYVKTILCSIHFCFSERSVYSYHHKMYIYFMSYISRLMVYMFYVSENLLATFQKKKKK